MVLWSKTVSWGMRLKIQRSSDQDLVPAGIIANQCINLQSLGNVLRGMSSVSKGRGTADLICNPVLTSEAKHLTSNALQVARSSSTAVHSIWNKSQIVSGCHGKIDLAREIGAGTRARLERIAAGLAADQQQIQWG
jgi:hypothetical protein